MRKYTSSYNPSPNTVPKSYHDSDGYFSSWFVSLFFLMLALEPKCTFPGILGFSLLSKAPLPHVAACLTMWLTSFLVKVT